MGQRPLFTPWWNSPMGETPGPTRPVLHNGAIGVRLSVSPVLQHVATAHHLLLNLPENCRHGRMGVLYDSRPTTVPVHRGRSCTAGPPPMRGGAGTVLRITAENGPASPPWCRGR